MNASLAIDAYTKVKNNTLSNEEIGYNVVSTALHKLELNLLVLFNSKNTKGRSKAYEQTLLTIYFLQKSLNFNSEDELARNLFRLYEFCRITVIEKGIAGSHNDPKVKKCQTFIAEIVSSWDSIDK